MQSHCEIGEGRLLLQLGAKLNCITILPFQIGLIAEDS